MSIIEEARATANDEAEGIVRELLVPFAVSDPYPLYRRLREIAPVFYSQAMDRWVVTGYEACLELLRSPAFGRGSGDEQLIRKNPRFAESHNLQLSSDMLPYIDPPQHTRLRRLVSRAFTPRRVQSLRSYIADLASDLFDKMEAIEREEGSVDLVANLSEPLPIAVICEMLGVPHDDHSRFTKWVHAVAQAIAGTEEALAKADRATESFVEYFAALESERRGARTDDLFSDLVNAQEDSDSFTPNELSSMCLALIGGGAETTTGLISNAVLDLHKNPLEADRLRADPDLDEQAIEEFLRFDPPLQSTFTRLVLEDTVLCGQLLSKGAIVVPFVAAADRDPSVVEDPDELRIDRDRSGLQQIAFGAGIHFCLGNALARLEGQVAIPGLLRRFPDLVVLDTDPPFRGNSMVRSIAKMQVRLGVS